MGSDSCLATLGRLIHGGAHVLEKEHRCGRVPDELGQVPSVRISQPRSGSPEYIAVDRDGAITRGPL